MKQTATETCYQRAFEKEAANEYPILDTVESTVGFAIDKLWLEKVAYPLNCPVKANPPNWQHGRMIYTLLRGQLEAYSNFVNMDSVLVDIGTAKGFSALVMAKALADSGERLPIYTVDVVDPLSRTVRNTVMEIDGLKTVPELVNPLLPLGQHISFYGKGSNELLTELIARKRHVFFAFVDGKHAFQNVLKEGRCLSLCQRKGDVTLFDDCQLEPVERAVDALEGYVITKVDIGPRRYAVARKL